MRLQSISNASGQKSDLEHLAGKVNVKYLINNFIIYNYLYITILCLLYNYIFVLCLLYVKTF